MTFRGARQKEMGTPLLPAPGRWKDSVSAVINDCAEEERGEISENREHDFFSHHIGFVNLRLQIAP